MRDTKVENDVKRGVDTRSARTTRILNTLIHAPEPTTVHIPQEERRAIWRVRLQRNWPFLAVMLLAALLRFIGLGDKPLQHDESLHAYFALQLMHNMEQWKNCLGKITCYHYDPLLHGPFQFHIIALVYKISQILGAPDHGVNTTTVRIAAALMGTALVSFPYLLRDYLGGRLPVWLACFLLAISPGMVYFSRFAREDSYMACFTLLLVAAAGRYIRDRKGYWLVLAGAAFALSYATKEATFLTAAIFGSFLVILLVWELGVRVAVPERFQLHIQFGKQAEHYFPRTMAPVALALFASICLPLAKWFFAFMKSLSITITSDPSAADTYMHDLKDQTQSALPWLAGSVMLCVIVLTVRDVLAAKHPDRQRALIYTPASRVDAEQQPVLSTILASSWVHWFVALAVSSFLFILLFSVLFTNLHHGIGDGIWQGIYYWLEQQNVARGGQPWYYYLLLISLYEQIGLVFGIVGLLRSLRQPTRFRLFLIYWMLGNLTLYSWAGEKMPWLMIHITMPMLLLAAIGLEPLVLRCVGFFQQLVIAQNGQKSASRKRNRVQSAKSARANARSKVMMVVAVVATIFLLAVTLQNMFQVTFVHYADGSYKMMIYVQTTNDVKTIMNKIDTLDRQKHDGRHTLSIGVMSDADWPFYWYLRDYTDVCYGFPTGCATANPEVIIGAGNDIIKTQEQYSANIAGDSKGSYAFRRYHLRSWWDEGYKPPVCVPSENDYCRGQPKWGGIGPWLWLSYGDSPPAQAQFDPFLAARNVWNWWWLRTPIGSTGGSTDVGLMIRSDLSGLVKP